MLYVTRLRDIDCTYFYSIFTKTTQSKFNAWASCFLHARMIFRHWLSLFIIHGFNPIHCLISWRCVWYRWSVAFVLGNLSWRSHFRWNTWNLLDLSLNRSSKYYSWYRCNASSHLHSHIVSRSCSSAIHYDINIHKSTKRKTIPYQTR